MRINPVIIIGMHRSGTTMITKHLQSLGLFVGKKKDENNESLYFRKLNDWMLNRLYSRWDTPPLSDLLSRLPDYKEEFIRVLQLHQSSLKANEYLGMLRYLKYRSIANIDFPWGWKDPRNTLTLDIWKELYPNSKIVHVYRNPIDIAQSLRVRLLSDSKKSLSSFDNVKNYIKNYTLINRMNNTDSLNVHDLNFGINLWKQYMGRAENLKISYSESFFEVKYEDYLSNPFFILKELAEYVLLSTNEDQIKRIVQTVDNSRKYSFVLDQELLDIYNSWKTDDIVKKFGYDTLISMQ